ncbi:hypothetical protein ACN47A_15815 [Myxococcus fulvus]
MSRVLALRIVGSSADGDLDDVTRFVRPTHVDATTRPGPRT